MEDERELKRCILSRDRQPALFSLNTHSALALLLILPPMSSLLAGSRPCPRPAQPRLPPSPSSRQPLPDSPLLGAPLISITETTTKHLPEPEDLLFSSLLLLCFFHSRCHLNPPVFQIFLLQPERTPSALCGLDPPRRPAKL